MTDFFSHRSGFSITRKRLVYILFLLTLVLGVQLPCINRPFLGHYASYQGTVMASMARNMLQENFSELLFPKTDVVIGGKRALHLNQYPFPSLIAALGVKLFGGTFEFWGRFQAIVFNLLSALCLILIAQVLFNERVAFVSTAIFLLSPYTLIYGQAFMSESMSLFFLLFSLYLLLRAFVSRSTLLYLLSSGLSFSIAVTGRIHFVLFYPIYCLYMLSRGKSGGKKALNLFIFTFFSLVIALTWYAHTYFVSLHANNVHTNIFLQLSDPGAKAENLLTELDYYRHVFDQISQTWLTPLLFPFLFLGLILLREEKKSFKLITGFVILGLSLIVLVPAKVMKHDFYLYGVFPFIAMVAGYGLTAILDAFPFLKTQWIGVLALVLYFAVSSRFFCHPIFKHPEAQRNIVRVAQIVQAQTKPKDQIIIAGNDLGAMFYYADRPGSSLQCSLVGKTLSPYRRNTRFARTNRDEVLELEQAMKSSIAWLEYLKRQGAAYLVASNKKELDTDACRELVPYLKQHYQSLSKDEDDFYLFRINHDS